MTFFAKRANGQDGAIVAAPDAVAVPGGLPPGAGMADAMMRKMLGVGLSDLQGIAEQAGEMLAAFDRRLAAIEAEGRASRECLDKIAAQNTEILARLEYLALRGRENVTIGDKHGKN